MTTRRSVRAYHHGDVPNAVLVEVLALIEEVGPAGVTFREVARRAGVSHASVAHHFGDKAGLFAAVAADGFRRLGDELTASRDRGEPFLELGVAYMRFAVAHRAHFDVMFRPDLFPRDHPAVVAAQRRAGSVLYGKAEEISEPGQPDGTLIAGVAGWAIVHGLANLWLTGNLPPSLGADPEEITRTVARLLG
jgi:AcrR family transcriptional regulator